MLDVIAQNGLPVEENDSAADAGAAYELVAGELSKGLLLICDHACNDLPARYGTLGLPTSELERHIAFDIGVGAVTRGLAERLGVPAVLSTFSRLLIDPNRGLDDPTLIMKISDGSVVPGNTVIGDEEHQRRISRYYAPYHAAVSGLIDDALAAGVVPALFSIHSFTPAWKGALRPWHAGLLWDPRDRRFTSPLVAGLRSDRELVVGDNEPYKGGLTGDTIDVHGTGRGLASALLEIRQDLISDDAGIAEWTGRLEDVLPSINAMPQLHEQLTL